MKKMDISKRPVIRLAFYPILLMFSVIACMIFVDDSVLDPCESTILSSSPAPDGRMDVVVFEKECGATTPFNTQASLAPAGKAFSPRKNPAFLVLDGKHTLSVTWTTPSVVEIGIPGEAKSFRKERSVGGVGIVYK